MTSFTENRIRIWMKVWSEFHKENEELWARQKTETMKNNHQAELLFYQTELKKEQKKVIPVNKQI